MLKLNKKRLGYERNNHKKAVGFCLHSIFALTFAVYEYGRRDTSVDGYFGACSFCAFGNSMSCQENTLFTSFMYLHVYFTICEKIIPQISLNKG